MVDRTAILPFLLLVLLMNGIQCRKKIDPYRTSAELRVLVDSFASECSRRGINVDISPASLQVGFGRITTQSGSCKPYSHPKVITIDSMIWKALTPAVREMLVYHELAHCLLQRKHFNEVLPSGECKSWMREDDSRCKINSINRKWRQYYIEELFSAEKVKEPDWYDYSTFWDFRQKHVTQGKIILTEFNSLLFDSSFFAGANDWRIGVRFAEPKTLQGYLNIKINEYAIQLVKVATFPDTTKSMLIRTVILDQFKFLPDKNILYTDTLRSPEMKFELSIRKIKQTVYVFFENDIRASIPFENSLTLRGYYFFKHASPYVISVHALESEER